MCRLIDFLFNDSGASGPYDIYGRHFFLKMPSNIEMNKWATKLTIIFQLTIWSIIGFIFLQKGVISLCEKTKARNDTINMQVRYSNRL